MSRGDHFLCACDYSGIRSVLCNSCHVVRVVSGLYFVNIKFVLSLNILATLDENRLEFFEKVNNRMSSA